jgi:hypothetical protein
MAGVRMTHGGWAKWALYLFILAFFALLALAAIFGRE